MNVMVMDVEGTDGRERGEDQVRRGVSLCELTHLHTVGLRISSASLHCSLWHHLKYCSSIFGSTKSASTTARTWVYSRLSSRSTWGFLARRLLTGMNAYRTHE